ncbi:hypothetical protein GOP47_0004614 [Adiantum capillus-veneris]|uniref:Uncharacterized protein n=1 Tax=Adiantum capillus-veneris TaxID=13818 RepID=A0A9D4ZPV1_ADICA|nr:hypothetical protein GOP47_0004614 [Adiantum capillus-veneris]
MMLVIWFRDLDPRIIILITHAVSSLLRTFYMTFTWSTPRMWMTSVTSNDTLYLLRAIEAKVIGRCWLQRNQGLNTLQLDKLAYVNANLRGLEKVGGLNSGGTVSSTIKQVDHKKVVAEVADISKLQPCTTEDDVYDFI